MTTRILFVDDEERVLTGYKRSLDNEHYDICLASDPLEAVSVLKSGPIDIIVSDQMMPFMNGTQFLSMAAKECPETVRIMITGYANLETAMAAVNKGEVFRFLAKPCSSADLKEAIKKALEYRKLLSCAKEALSTLKMQNAYIEHLEEKHPGLTKVERDDTGAVVINEDYEDVEQILQNLEEELQKVWQKNLK